MVTAPAQAFFTTRVDYAAMAAEAAARNQNAAAAAAAAA
eukprot:CAMPEP_0168389204 /NCGR_PEP_ID=MMETSP0228-20121227/16846_1 /TAXON_ID=133427 /ORGANISM="Protoceratium reticulatum, Strain CCCM 535 (=CCMP 1889)" /LENGTH=38 /DNA_ID= /DNA_START= /DNA_END= /DNA_ORIENTATION=